MDEFEYLKIQLEEIKKATNNFGNKVIGSGGFGKVYEGEVSHSKGKSKVAIKRLDRNLGQGDLEFWKEIMMLSFYTHKNLISLLGFCDEDNEKILVYEHASNRSLDRHLSSTNLTWTQRINICIDAAWGINYLHDPKGTQQRVIHRDIKSSNILLDDKWNAKVSDMGLSKTGPANQKHTFLVTNVVGTPGYCDPLYMETYKLTKESDVYSFGVVLFEVLCGRLCIQISNGQLEILVPMWKQSYEQKKLDDIIFRDLKSSMDSSALQTFSDIAFRCLNRNREQRPTMSHVVDKLEVALKFQKHHDIKQAKDYEERIKGEEAPQKYRYFEKLKAALSEMVFNWGENKPLPVKKFVRFEGTAGFAAADLLSVEVCEMGENAKWFVYRARIEDGDEFLVRVFRESITKNQREFEIEVNLIGKIRHPNLLALRAYYIHPNGAKFLVSDYMPKGNLATFLHSRGPKTRIDWATSLQIAKGIARGLISLHTDHNIIHGNLTSSNIFLDENMNPKIADFGLSLLIKSDKMSNMVTSGYKAPELEKANAKTDVYSLGVIMLQLLTGESPQEGVDLMQWVASIVKQEWINYEISNDQLLNTLKLALHCVDPSPSERPHVQMVLQRLEEIRSETATNSTDDGDAGPSKRV